MFKKSIFASLIVFLAFSITSAKIPQQINYQGSLSDQSGNPINATVSIEFKIYDTATAGSALWNETQSVTVADGIFSVLLGSVTLIPVSVFDGNDKYLGIKIGTDPETTPRKKLVSIGYAFRAEEANKLEGKSASDFALSSHHHDSRYYQQSQLNTNDGTVNQTSDPVSWYKIKDMPTGFADGSDDRGGGGDDLGNHTATENIKLNGHYLSNDGGNEGISVDNSGNINVSGYLEVGSYAGSLSSGHIGAEYVHAERNLWVTNGYIRVGSSSSSWNNGDIVAEGNVKADDDVIAGNSVIADYSVEGNVVKALNFIYTVSENGAIYTGNPQNMGYGDIASTDDLYADDDLFCGGTKSAYTKTSNYGTRLFYSEEATEVYFFDRGQAQLVNGEAVIQIDPIFIEAVTIDNNNPIIVQITLTADCNGIFVSNKAQNSFTVKELMKGNSNATFDWEVCAKRKNHETVRMELLEQNNQFKL